MALALPLRSLCQSFSACRATYTLIRLLTPWMSMADNFIPHFVSFARYSLWPCLTGTSMVKSLLQVHSSSLLFPCCVTFLF